jgi:hypothetical protein
MAHRRTVVLPLVLTLLGGVATIHAQKSKRAMTKPQVIELVENGVSSTRVEELVRAYGITFEVTPEVVAEFRHAGATEDLVKALREIGTKPEPATSTAKPEASAAPAPTATAPAPPAPAVLTLETTPPGAEVYVDEERVGKTGPEGKLKISTLSAGEHRVRVSAAGHEDLSRSVELTAGQTTVVAVALAAVRPAAAEPAAPSQTPSGSPGSAVGISPGDSPLDVYKMMMGGMSGQSDPNLKRFYVTHEHGKSLRALGYGGGMCYGWLIIGNGRVQFSSNEEDDAFDVAANAVTELQIKSNHVRFRANNKRFHLMTQDMGMLGGDSQGPGALRAAFESVGLKAQSK